MPGSSALPLLSVVVPARNEAEHIAATLDRLVAQDAIDEIIVVDNGSSDRTAEIVSAYMLDSARVTLVSEPRRGISHARDAGFDKARGDIVARTDADTLVAADWGDTVRAYLVEHPETAAVTGLTRYYDSPLGFVLRFAQELQVRRGRLGGPVGKLSGRNMAIRRSVWQQVRADTAHGRIAEDLDLALCITKRGLRIDQVTGMRAQTSARRRRSNPADWWHYQRCGLRTVRGQGYAIRPGHRVAATLAWLGHTVQWPVYRFWDFDRRRFTPHGARPRRVSIG